MPRKWWQPSWTADTWIGIAGIAIAGWATASQYVIMQLFRPNLEIVVQSDFDFWPEYKNVLITNTGRGSAEEIEIVVVADQVSKIDVEPPLATEIARHEDNSVYKVKYPRLHPGEQFSITLVPDQGNGHSEGGGATPSIIAISAFKSKEGLAYIPEELRWYKGVGFTHTMDSCLATELNPCD